MTNLDYALKYAEMGWHVLPLHSINPNTKRCTCPDPTCVKVAAKHPVWQLVPHGHNDATTDPALIKHWWTHAPAANIGIRTGKISGIVVVDIDRGYGPDTWDSLIIEHGAPPDTIDAATGGGGRHLVFAYPDEIDSIPSRVGALGTSIDIRADGGYIVVAPSIHRTGAEYEWEASSDPLEGVRPAPLPEWILKLLQQPKQSQVDAIPDGEAVLLVPDRVREIRSALTVVPADDRDTWLQVGMALHSTDARHQAFGLWTEWSQTSDKYNARDQARVWKSFKKRDGISISSLFAIAHKHGWVPIDVPDLISDTVKQFTASLTGVSSGTPPVAPPVLMLAKQFDAVREIPKHLLSPPGILGDITKYGLDSSVRPVPIFAVQAALALGSVVCGRRYVTSNRNYSALYFLNIAKSGTGKEEAKTTIERILAAAKARRLIGGSSYTSGNAVYSALLNKPQHLTVIDEFGKYLEAAMIGRDSFRSDALTMLMESFGRVHGDMTTPQFSSMTKSASQAVDMEPKIIQRPSITLLAMTTPRSFYDAMRSSRVADGFLNRFIVVEHAGPRLPAGEFSDIPVPDRIVSWVEQILAPHGNVDTGTTLDNLPDARVVALTPAAKRLSAAFEADMLALADRWEDDGLGDMPIRTREVAMRLSLVVSLGESPDAPSVTESILDWCFEYAKFFLFQTADALRHRVADTEIERIRNNVLMAIKAKGAYGVSDRDMHRGKAFVGISKRDRAEAIESLMQAELIARVMRPNSGAGRPVSVWVAIDPDASESEEEQKQLAVLG